MIGPRLRDARLARHLSLAELESQRKTARNERAAARALSLQVEELLAQVDFVCDELSAVSRRVRRR